MKLNIYAVVILAINVVFSLFVMDKSNTYQSSLKDTTIQSDTFFNHK